MKKKKYKKHIYWISKASESRLKKSLAQKGINLKSAKGVMCTPLDELNKVSSVAPEIWNDICGRQGSWYRCSEYRGMVLIVSSFELADYRKQHVAVITTSDFKPPQTATWEEKADMLKNPELLRRIPRQWQHADDNQKKIYLRWVRRLGHDIQDFEKLHLSHTANHLNFMHPRFFIQQGDLTIPYSIDRSAFLCSSCLELYQVLGSEWPMKFVAPCPGATIFARLTPDRYLCVKKPG